MRIISFTFILAALWSSDMETTIHKYCHSQWNWVQLLDGYITQSVPKAEFHALFIYICVCITIKSLSHRAARRKMFWDCVKWMYHRMVSPIYSKNISNAETEKVYCIWKCYAHLESDVNNLNPGLDFAHGLFGLCLVEISRAFPLKDIIFIVYVIQRWIKTASVPHQLDFLFFKETLGITRITVACGQKTMGGREINQTFSASHYKRMN